MAVIEKPKVMSSAMGQVLNVKTPEPMEDGVARMRDMETFVEGHGWTARSLIKIAGDASFRSYYRVWNEDRSAKAIVMDAPPEKERTDAFIAVTRWMQAAGLRAPKILAMDEGLGFLILEDLGDALFARILDAQPDREDELYFAAMDALITMQRADVSKLDCGKHDAAKLQDENLRFAEWFLPQAVGREAAEQLMLEWVALWGDALSTFELDCETCVHADYHAENLLWLSGSEGTDRVGLLDYQDAMAGHAALDVVSLLQDARRDVSPALEAKMLAYYCEKMGLDEAAFKAQYDLYGAQRNLRIVGVFTRLALRDAKPKYLHYLPRVWGYVERNTAEQEALQPLRRFLDAHVPKALRGVIELDRSQGHLSEADSPIE